MNIELVIGLVSGAVAVFSVGLTIWGQFRTMHLEAELQNLRTAEQRQFDARKTLARYREPLVSATYDLQSRLYNIVCPTKNLTERYFKNGDERERSYVVNNTAYLIAQYFCWTEIIRHDIQYMDLGEDKQTRALARLHDTVYSLWQTDRGRFSRHFRVFAGEQRAIGERMIGTTSRGPKCIGYAAFLDLLDKSPDPLIDTLRQDVREIGDHFGDVRPRLIALQNALIDLLKFLDPSYVRFPSDRRTKLSTDEPHPSSPSR